MAAKTPAQPHSFSAVIGRLLHRDSSLGYILITPGFAFLTVMMAYPFVYAVYLSFTDTQIGGPGKLHQIAQHQPFYADGNQFAGLHERGFDLKICRWVGVGHAAQPAIYRSTHRQSVDVVAVDYANSLQHDDLVVDLSSKL